MRVLFRLQMMSVLARADAVTRSGRAIMAAGVASGKESWVSCLNPAFSQSFWRDSVVARRRKKNEKGLEPMKQ